jgi:hypothetical protein
MQPTTVGFFEEAPGHKSSMRLFSFILLLFSCAFSFYYVMSKGCDLNPDFIAFEMVQLVAVFAPKYLQKVAEMKLRGSAFAAQDIITAEPEKKP